MILCTGVATCPLPQEQLADNYIARKFLESTDIPLVSGDNGYMTLILHPFGTVAVLSTISSNRSRNPFGKCPLQRGCPSSSRRVLHQTYNYSGPYSNYYYHGCIATAMYPKRAEVLLQCDEFNKSATFYRTQKRTCMEERE